MTDTAPDTPAATERRRYFNPKGDPIGWSIGIFGLIAGAITAAVQGRTPVEIFVTSLFSSFAIAALLGVIIVILMSRLKRLTNLSIENERLINSLNIKFGESEDLFRTNEALLAASESKRDTVTRVFAELHSIEREFGDVETHYRRLLIDPGNQDISENWTELTTKFHILMSKICNTGKKVIGSDKDVELDSISASIKILARKDGESVYRSIARSSNSSSFRKARDERLSKNPPLVASNRIFDEIINGESNHCIIQDMDAYFSDTVRRNEGLRQDKQYVRPNARTAETYKSCIIVPLKGGYGTVMTPSHIDVMAMNSSHGEVVGFLCVDSEKKVQFNTGNDLMVMQQLADQAFSAIRSYYYSIMAQKPQAK